MAEPSDDMSELEIRLAMHHDDQDYDESIRCCELMLAVDPDCQVAMLRKGDALAAKERHEEAIAMYTCVLDKSPESEEAQQGIEAVRTQLKEIEAAILQKRKRAEIVAQVAKAREEQVKAKVEAEEEESTDTTDEEEEEEEEEEEAGESGAASAEDLKVQGNALFKAQKYGEAIGVYDRAIQQSLEEDEGPDRDTLKVAILGNRSMCHWKLDNFEAMLSDCQDALVINPGYVKGHLRSGLALAALNRPQEAWAEYNMAFELEPHNEQAIRGRKDMKGRLQQQKWLRVKTRKSEYQAVAMANDLVRYGRCLSLKDEGNDLMRAENTSGAIERYTEAIGGSSDAVQQSPLMLQLLGNRAQAYLKAEDWLKALTDCEAVLELDKENTKARLRGGTAAAELKNFDKAYEHFYAVLQVEPANNQARNGAYKVEDMRALHKAEASKEVAKSRYQDGRYAEAARLYGQAITILTTTNFHLKQSRQSATALHVTLLNNRAACYMAVSESKKALVDCAEAVKLDPTCSKAQMRAAKAHMRLGDFAAAQEAASTAMAMEEMAPKELRIAQLERQKMTTFAQQHGKLTEKIAAEDFAYAILICDALLKDCPEAETVRLRRTECLIDAKRFSEARKAADELWEAAENSAGNVYGVLGETLIYTEAEPDKGVQMVKQALKHKPENAARLRKVLASVEEQMEAKNKGNVFFKARDYEAAIEEYGRGVEMEGPLGPTLYCNRAACFMALKKYDQAVQNCSEAIERSPKMEKAFRRRAQCYTEMEEFAKAVSDYQHLSENHPTREHRQLLQEAKAALKRSKKKDYYKILGVARDATEQEIKKAFKRSALKHHPDKVAPEDRTAAEKKFKELNEAHEHLTDRQLRRKHDLGEDSDDDDGGFSNFFRRSHQPRRRGPGGFGGGFGGFNF